MYRISNKIVALTSATVTPFSKWQLDRSESARNVENMSLGEFQKMENVHQGGFGVAC